MYRGGKFGSPCSRVLTVSNECINISPHVPPVPPASIACKFFCVVSLRGSNNVAWAPLGTKSYMKIRRTGLLFLLQHMGIPGMPDRTGDAYLIMNQRRWGLCCRSRVRSRRREQAEHSRGQAHGNMSRHWTPEYGRARGGVRGMPMSEKERSNPPVDQV